MNKLRNLGCLLLLLLVGHVARAQNQSGWSCNASDWQYDMTVFAVVAYSNGSPVTDQSNYEIGAFVGTECRGVADGANTKDLWTAGPNNDQVFYLRVRSNTSSGENVTFKVYDKTSHSELPKLTFTPVTFSNNAMIGEASSPFVLKQYKSGDVNGDNKVNVTDVGMVIDHILERTLVNFIKAAADMNNDGKVNVTDVGLIIDDILSDKPSAKQRGGENKTIVLDPQ